MPTFRTRIPAAAVVLLACSLPASAQASGAIWTTGPAGSPPNGNVFTDKSQAYLRTGPDAGNPCLPGGLADGTYYFQVTDPSGSVLLSSDAIAGRMVAVSGGSITGPGTTGTHALAGASCGLIVQLAPFADSPSAGGQYKVWLTSVGDYSSGDGFFGFLPSKSKSSSFKVVPPGLHFEQSIIAGTAFYDFDTDGAFDPLSAFELPIAGWRIEIWKNGIFEEATFTDQDGKYEFIRDRDGSPYEIIEFAPPPGYIPLQFATWLNTGPVSAIAQANSGNVAGPDFGNVQFGLAPGVGRSKGFWHNQGEPLLLDCDPEWRDALGTSPWTGFLRYPVSSADPLVSVFHLPHGLSFAEAFSQFSDWIVGLSAKGHAGYQLSNQVAATILNNTCGFMQGPIYIDRFQTAELESLSSMLDGAIGLLSDPCAGLTGPSGPKSCKPLRDAILACLNEFTTINNTSNLQEPQVVYKPKEASDEFLSPYDR